MSKHIDENPFTQVKKVFPKRQPKFLKKPSPYTYKQPNHEYRNQHDFINLKIASLFFEREKQIDIFLHERRKLRRMEERIAKECAPYELGNLVTVLANGKYRPPITCLVYKIAFTPRPPYFQIYFREVKEIKGNETILSKLRIAPSLSLVTLYKGGRVPDYDQLVASGAIEEDVETYVADETEIPREVKSKQLGDKLAKENPSLAVDWANGIISMSRPFNPDKP